MAARKEVNVSFNNGILPHDLCSQCCLSLRASALGIRAWGVGVLFGDFSVVLSHVEGRFQGPKSLKIERALQLLEKHEVGL